MKIYHKRYDIFKNFLVFQSSNRHCSIIRVNESDQSLEERTQYDLAIIGGGIIGAAIAREVKAKSNDVKTILIEKENCLGKHQSSHNSGVIHAVDFGFVGRGLKEFNPDVSPASAAGIVKGKCEIEVFFSALSREEFFDPSKMLSFLNKIIKTKLYNSNDLKYFKHGANTFDLDSLYYKPGSLKSKFCVRGAELLIKYCKEHNVTHRLDGKLVVATDLSQIDILKELYKRGEANGVKDLKILQSLEEIIKVEPTARGMHALWSPNTGNVDFQVVTESFGKDFRKLGGDILLHNEVKCIKPSGDSDFPILLKCNENLFLKTKFLITGGGLWSGTLSDLIDRDDNRIFISLRVDYQLLPNKYIPTNIYAVPYLDLPFLGVHLSPKLDGSTLLGPTAVPAFKIDGYEKDEIKLSYLKNVLGSTGLQNMTKRYFSNCLDQVTQNICTDLQVKKLQKLAHFKTEDVCSGPTAVQTQLLNEDGTFTDDFVFEFFKDGEIKSRIINCKFMPSPAATSSLAIAEYVVEKFLTKFNEKV